MGISNQAPSDAGSDNAEPAAKRRRRQGATYKNYYEFRTIIITAPTNGSYSFVRERRMGREALSTEVWLQGTCSDVQLHRLSYLRPRRARAGGQRELSLLEVLGSTQASCF